MATSTSNMRKIMFLIAATASLNAAHSQTGRVCLPFDSTFHFLKQGNINFWVQAGGAMTRSSSTTHFFNNMAFNLHYVPVRYLQTGLNLSKRLPPSQGASFWKSYELSAFARYSFLRLDCARTGVFAQSGYTWMVDVQKQDGSKTANGSPYLGIGIYKDLSTLFSLQLENQLYFNRRPNEVSLNLTWKFMNLNLKLKQ